MGEKEIVLPAVYDVKIQGLRSQIRERLLQIEGAIMGFEQYCEYKIEFVCLKKKITVKQYQSGKLVVQGSDTGFLDKIINQIEDVVGESNNNKKREVSADIKATAPFIGSDESGKGDFFGPLVVCAFWANIQIATELEKLDVKDSKMLSNKNCAKIAKTIREEYSSFFKEVILLPKEYNILYSRFKQKGESLNQLLGYLHSLAIKNIWDKRQANSIIVDKFGNENDVKRYFDKSHSEAKFICIPRGESQTVVAAASIIARDRFVREMSILSDNIGEDIPFGAGPQVVDFAKDFIRKYGPDKLSEYAKTHFSTASQAGL